MPEMQLNQRFLTLLTELLAILVERDCEEKRNVIRFVVCRLVEIMMHWQRSSVLY
jgi:hypothetical protein